MDRGKGNIRAIVLNVGLLVVAALGIAAWYMGPWSRVSLEAKELVHKGEVTYQRAEKGTQKLRELDKTVSAIRLSASTEDLQKVQKDLNGYLENVEKARLELSRSSASLRTARMNIIPGWYRDYIDLLIKRNEKLENCLNIFTEEFRTLKKEIEIAPGLVKAIDDLESVFKKLEQIYVLYRSEDFSQASTVIDQAESESQTVTRSFNETAETVKKEQHVKKTRELLEAIGGFFKTLRTLVSAAGSQDKKAKDEAVKKVQMESAVLDAEIKLIGLNKKTEGWLTRQHAWYKEKAERAFSQAIILEGQADKLIRKHD